MGPDRAFISTTPWLFVAALCAAQAASASTVTTLYALPGSSDTEFVNTINQNGVFYGTTFDLVGGKETLPGSYGTAYSFDPAADKYTTLYNFTLAQGAFPNFSSPLAYVNGMLYGTTAAGGLHKSGMVFELDPATGAETTIYNFTQHATTKQFPGLRLPVKHTPWYGNPGSYSGVIYANGLLYGTTYGGGTAGLGSIFQIDPKSGAESTLYSFGGATDGAGPMGQLLYNKGKLFGTAVSGGTGQSGTVFSYKLNDGKETTLYTFAGGTDGATPVGGLIIHAGILYGSTSGGGTFGAGTLFTLDTSTNTEAVLHSFTGGGDGKSPNGNLIYQKGTLYGTTLRGGSNPYLLVGTIFAVSAKTGTETTLFDFGGCDEGSSPVAGMILANGTFYGTTTDCAKGSGTIFQLQP